MNNSCLLLFYDLLDKNLDWREGNLPLFIGRLATDPVTAKTLIGKAIEYTGKINTQMVLIIADSEENLGLLEDKYEKFAMEHNCYIEWDIEDIDILESEPVAEEAECACQGSCSSDTNLLIFYGKPLFSPASLDITKETPMAIYEIEGQFNNTMLTQIVADLTLKGLQPMSWIVVPYTDERYDYFSEKPHEFIEMANTCLACLEEADREFAVCRNCKCFYMRDYCQTLLEQGITELYYDSDE